MIKLTDELRQKILREYEHWYNANRSKNSQFDTQKDLRSAKTNEEKLKSQIFWSVMRTIQATCIINEPDTVREDEDVLFQQEARNFSDMYKSDYTKNNRDFDKYIGLEDICKYWKFVQLFTGFDEDNLCPTVERIDPRFVYPYNDGTKLVKDYPFFWFDRIITIDQLKELDVKNKFKDRVCCHYDEFIDSQKTTDSFHRNINTFYDKVSWMVTIHYHYTYIKGELYLVLMLGEYILDIYDVPETKWRWKNRMPIAVTGFAYEGSDRWGVSLVDIIEDSHRTEELMLNLFKIKATREATGGNIFIDEEAFLKNKESFKNQSLKNRWYPIKMRDMTKSINSMVYELPQQAVAGDIYNMLNMIKNKAMAESFASAVGQGLGLSENSNPNTATQSKIQKINANMMTTLQNQILSYWSEDFAVLYRMYMLYYWRNSKKKVIRRVLGGLSGTYKKLSKKDIAGEFNIIIEDPIQRSIKMEDKKKALTEQYNMLVNDPNTPPFILNNIRKSICYYNGLDENEIDAVNLFDPEEYQCKQDVILLNNNIPIYIPPTANPHMRLRYYNKAEETEAKFQAIESLKYMIQQWMGNNPQNMAEQPKVEQPLTEKEQEQELITNGLQSITQ